MSAFHMLARGHHVFAPFSILILINQPKKTNLPLIILEITKKSI